MNTSNNKQNDQEIIATSLSTMDENCTTLFNEPRENLLDRGIPSSDLVAKLAGDVMVACGVTLGIAPFMSIIDKSVVQRVAGTHTITQSCIESVLTMVRNPVTFVKSPMFLMMWGVYASTYTTANCLKTLVEHQENGNKNHKSTNTSSSAGTFGVFAMTTTVNSATSLIKDKFYARHFGATASKMPLITYGLWGLRDCTVIGSSFILPEYMCSTLQEHTDLDRKTALQLSQLTCPLVAQVVATPAQMLGLDFYNRPLSDMSYKAAALERFRFQYANFSSILSVRIVRIAPSYGIGGVGNTYFRDMWRDYLNERDVNGISFQVRNRIQ